MDVVLLSRVQFALTIMFHYLFPPLTIGLGVVLVFLEYRWLRTNDSNYHSAAQFWTKMFGINFALGVATGIVDEYLRLVCAEESSSGVRQTLVHREFAAGRPGILRTVVFRPLQRRDGGL